MALYFEITQGWSGNPNKVEKEAYEFNLNQTIS
jgi:hypothetical protein